MNVRSKDFFIISLAILFTVTAWIVVDVFHLQKNQKFTVDYEKSMQFDIKSIKNIDILNRLEKRK